MADSVKRIVPPSVSRDPSSARYSLSTEAHHHFESAVTGNRSTQSPNPDHVEGNHAECNCLIKSL